MTTADLDGLVDVYLSGLISVVFVVGGLLIGVAVLRSAAVWAVGGRDDD